MRDTMTNKKKKPVEKEKKGIWIEADEGIEEDIDTDVEESEDDE
jgi:hypothetical protein